MTEIDSRVCPAVAVALALEELDRLRATEQLPTPEALQDRLRARAGDFHLVAGVALAFFRAQVQPSAEAQHG